MSQTPAGLGADEARLLPEALARMGDIDFVARLLVEGGHIGQHRSPFKGASVEFVEHRPYYPGDEIRHIDWRAFGKTGEYYVKEFEEETNLRAYLLVDCSGSMAYQGASLSKWMYARQLAMVLAYLLLTQRDAVGLMTFDQRLRDRVDPTTQKTGLSIMAAHLQQRSPGGEGSVIEALGQILPALKRRSLVLIITDGFGEVAHWNTVFQQLRAARQETILFQTLAPEEITFSFQKPTQFCSLETESRLLVDPHRFRKDYLERFARHQQELAEACVRHGVDQLTLQTDQPYHLLLGQFLARRAGHA